MARYQRRNEQTQQAIKRALLSVLSVKPFSKIGVTDIAREAGISRSTFYSHFASVQEVFDACTADFTASARPLKTQLRCSSCTEEEASGRPFCECVRNSGEYEPLVRDPHFLAVASSLLLRSEDEDGVISDYTGMGLDADQARVIALFQLSGCYAAASAEPHDADWTESRSTIDTFIRGGVNAVRAASRLQPSR